MAEKNVSYRSKLLISNSSIVADDFNRSVVLMIEHDPSGSFGLVINKQSRFLLREVVMGVPIDGSTDINMFWGGPVDHSFITILHDNDRFSDPGIPILPGVFLSRSYDVLMRLLKSNDSNYNVYHGYSGWGALQLESEFQRKSWAVLEAKPEFIFNENPESIWREALRSKGGIYQYFAEKTKDPMLN
ncbi:MAG: YqgE/AlgH family protein [Leptospiraceae bacterium]|nr:YqgE/AlgH family protein [Leptospiraceae bacterium]MCP5494155.1 YqgE/AlgH family protein [Leptospiraceae bacterium]